jgi:hypothetical protein
MPNPKGYIIEYEKDARVRLVIVVASSPEQALVTARREKEPDTASVIDESEFVFAD